jgi:hypothetical protein
MHEMTTNRLEACSDGVIAIIITIMVLELRAPAQPTLAALVKVAPVFLSYQSSAKSLGIDAGDGQRDDGNTRCLQDISKIESPKIEY